MDKKDQRTQSDGYVDDYLSQFPSSRPTKKAMELKIIVGQLLMHKEKEAKAARKVISRMNYITLATASKKGLPWNTPLYYAYDKEYTFYWISSVNSVHSANIAENENVAIVIYDSTVPEGKGFGVYMSAKASVMESLPQIEGALKILYKRKRKPAPDASKFFGDSLRKVYKAVPELFFVNDLKSKSEERRDLRFQVKLK
ncbi:MAG: pyridoxamine 5'-phosphate oxidase family protein [Candidatus Micrarchaeota archaeon]|nr:pyridoxamine 5'-phosphate oxidase family protein [Candidatus Micrarchaeota archaeon]